jgi:hypothetical protein
MRLILCLHRLLVQQLLLLHHYRQRHHLLVQLGTPSPQLLNFRVLFPQLGKTRSHRCDFRIPLLQPCG